MLLLNNNHPFCLSCHLIATNVLKKINRISFFVFFAAASKCFLILIMRKILIGFALFYLIPIDVLNAFVLIEIRSVMFGVL